MQPSLFSAEILAPELSDLGGLLAAHGQVATSPAGVRLSILLEDSWRGSALADECRLRGVFADVEQDPGTATGAPRGGSEVLLRTERTKDLVGLAASWTRGAVKSAPSDLVPTSGFLRLWVLASGAPDTSGYVLRLDRQAPDTWQPLASALARAGLVGALLGAGSANPAIRITGRRRIDRLAEMVGGPPPQARAGRWPDPGYFGGR